MVTTGSTMSGTRAETYALSVKSLKKSYRGGTEALAGLDLDIGSGEIFGLVGPDGAGKSTALKILAGVMEPTSGAVSILGQKPKQARSKIGYMPQNLALYHDLTVDENLEYEAGLHRLREEEFCIQRNLLLERMGLLKFSNRLAGQLSGGMKQKLALCCALISRPPILLLDEPTTGLDPMARKELWYALHAVAHTGTCIVIATPDLDEAERCNRIALIHEGKIIETLSPQDLPKPKLAHVENSPASPPLSALEHFFITRLKEEGLEEQDPPPFPRISEKSKPSASITAIGCRDLSKRFGSYKAVKNVSLEIRRGEIFGLVGANGAGKTSTIKMLCGLLEPSSGAVILNGGESRRWTGDVRKQFGYMSQEFTLYKDLTVRENLNFYAAIFEINARERKEKIDWALEACGLKEMENLLLSRIPRGWKQRIAFGAAVLHEPSILLLDEPTAGVDPVASRQLWKLIRQFAKEGAAVLLTTHLMDEARFCDRLGLMTEGSLITQGTPDEITRKCPARILNIRTKAPNEVITALAAIVEPARLTIKGDEVQVLLDGEKEETNQIQYIFKKVGLDAQFDETSSTSLEDAFIATIRRERNRHEQAVRSG